MASPSTVPLVPGVQALGTACSGAARGLSSSRLALLNSQPRPKSSKASSWTLLRPHSVNFSRVQALARPMAGELVRRGPICSVRYCSVSATCERWKASCRILPTIARSTVSSAWVAKAIPSPATSAAHFIRLMPNPRLGC